MCFIEILTQQFYITIFLKPFLPLPLTKNLLLLYLYSKTIHSAKRIMFYIFSKKFVTVKMTQPFKNLLSILLNIILIVVLFYQLRDLN